MKPSSTFDVVVVGAGSAGCVIAGRLSQIAHLRVLLLEAGGDNTEPWLHVPAGYYRTMLTGATDWGYIGAPEPQLQGRRIRHPRGKVRGGCSSTNGLVYIRGASSDYDSWAAALSDETWRYQDVLPLFRRSERNLDLDNEYHGREGPIRVAGTLYRSDLTEAFVDAAVMHDLPINNDFNGRTLDGVGYYQITADPYRRSSATAFLDGAGPALEVRLCNHVLRIVVLDGRAVGLEILSGPGSIERIGCTQAIVLSAGAFGTPCILQRSGIGDPALLRALGIPVTLENTAVGSGLQDHLQVRVMFETAPENSLNQLQRGILNDSERPGLVSDALTVGAGAVGLFARSHDGVVAPDIQFHVIPFSAALPGKLHDTGGVTVSVCALRPESRGFVAISGLDPADAPHIECAYLSEPDDIRPIREGLRLMQQLAPSVGSRFIGCLSPVSLDASAAELDRFIRATSSTIFHPIGTCTMARKGGVVDSRLRMKGVEHLWIADASVMPSIVSGNTNAACMMIGERAADELAAALGVSRPWAV